MINVYYLALGTLHHKKEGVSLQLPVTRKIQITTDLNQDRDMRK